MLDYAPEIQTVTIVDTIPFSPVAAAFTVLNWLLILSPVIFITLGIIFLVKKKTLAGIILLAIAFPVPILLFVLAAIANSVILG